MNTELFRKVRDSAAVEGALNMSYWEDDRRGACGTSRCIAGWAVYHALGEKPVYSGDDLSPAARELAGSLGVGVDVSPIAEKLLDLPPDVAGALFYVDDDAATEFLNLVVDDEAAALALLTDVEDGDW